MEKRELKFRGLTSDNEFVYGDIHNDAPNSTIYYNEYSQRLAWFEGNAHCNRPVKNGTVGQYIGLKDKNGVEIYEGDLLMIMADTFDTDTKGHEVVFGNYSIGRDDYGIEHQTACFCIKFNDDSGYCGIDEEVLVIGNIHENHA